MPKLSRSHLQILSDRIANFDRLPDSALLDVCDIHILSKRSYASIWRDVHQNRLAVPIKIGRNATRWRAGDVRVYLSGIDQSPRL